MALLRVAVAPVLSWCSRFDPLIPMRHAVTRITNLKTFDLRFPTSLALARGRTGSLKDHSQLI
jgi:hypothetical protein